jgi:urea transporter
VASNGASCKHSATEKFEGGNMKRFIEQWEALCASSPILRFVDINLRGVGQVMFQDNPLTGLLFLAAIARGSFAARAPEVFIAGVIAVVTATLAALWLRADRPTLNAGLYGYNGVLVGLALATFITPGPLLWVYVVLGAAVSVVATLGTANALRPFGVAALTFPFVIVTWILLLATYGFSGLAGEGLPSAAVISPVELLPENPLGLIDFVRGVLLSISQVFLKGSGIAALLLLAGLAVSSVAAAAFALGGAILAVATAHLFGAESDLIVGGLLGFSPVLTAIALGAVFHRPSLRVAGYAAVATIFTVVAQAALDVGLRPFAIPALTAPFILVSWMFLLPRQSLEEGQSGGPDSGAG